MGVISLITTYIAPLFIVVSPITSYADQIWSIQRTRSSAGFSLDIPLIMLVSSILRVYYWVGAHFDRALLLQAALMILMHTLLLKVALDHRPPAASAKGAAITLPFAPEPAGTLFPGRPFGFWQWRSTRPYWDFLLYFGGGMLVLTLLGSGSPVYVACVGYAALGVEATLPLPQLYTNWARQTCAGFRPSVLVNWIVGDVLKMMFFFLAAGESKITWAFKLCGMFQFACDIGLGLQYLKYGDEDGLGARDGGVGEKGWVGLRVKEKEARLS
ncbi:MAG: hypothetical protein M1829_006532 [Trizodia sp. TS-e1964]|nr:MAG: hypothetical protein M1829_006532 [Trizodia sp. TS-e1964]